MYRQVVLMFMVFLLLSGKGFSQAGSSPYTLFGLGTLVSEGTSRSMGMGGTGLALLSNTSITCMNPASYNGIDSLRFIFDFGLYGKYSNYTTTDEKQHTFDAAFRYLMIGFRINRWWAMSAGIIPFSIVDYRISTLATVEGTLTSYQKYFSGTGGLTRAFVGTSVRPFRNLFLGINVTDLFGSIKHEESAVFADKSLLDFDVIKTSRVNNLMLDYGLIYSLPLKDWTCNLGMVFSSKRDLTTVNEMTFVSDIDTIELDASGIEYFVPAKMGLGLMISKNNRFTAGFDYERMLWSGMDFDNPYLRSRDSERYSFGIEYVKRGKYSDYGYQYFFLRLGGSYHKTYMVINNTPIDARAITIGAGLPVKRTLSMVDVAFEFGTHGTTQRGLFRDRYAMLHLNLNLHDIWFQKRKFD